jgi:hypothetical protein
MFNENQTGPAPDASVAKTIIPKRGWVDDEGSRVFPFDAFVSHNRGDRAKNLIDLLREHGVELWHDGDEDPLDQQVEQRVARALAAARFILLCVGDDFRNSDWVRVEYEPALSLEMET